MTENQLKHHGFPLNHLQVLQYSEKKKGTFSHYFNKFPLMFISNHFPPTIQLRN